MHRGFSFIELVMVLLITALLLVIAMPSWQSLRISSQITVEVNQLLKILAFARSEALLRHFPLTLCKSSDHHTCGGEWSDGQILFIDKQQQGRVSSPQSIVRVFKPLARGTHL